MVHVLQLVLIVKQPSEEDIILFIQTGVNILCAPTKHTALRM